MRTFRPILLRLLPLLAVAGSAAAGLPETVPGLEFSGTATRAVAVAVRDARGAARSDVRPAIAVLRPSPWSPADPVRDGAREFEVFLTLASLLRSNPLAGVVGIGNRNGRLMPETEEALRRSALMGVPVVKVADRGEADEEPENLFVEAGPLSARDAGDRLAECILKFGTLPPCRDATHPTADELAAIERQVARYQLAFRAAGRGSLALAP